MRLIGNKEMDKDTGWRDCDKQGLEYKQALRKSHEHIHFPIFVSNIGLTPLQRYVKNKMVKLLRLCKLHC